MRRVAKQLHVAGVRDIVNVADDGSVTIQEYDSWLFRHQRTQRMLPVRISSFALA